jgi:hypothetical protein
MEINEFINRIKDVHEDCSGTEFIDILEECDKYVCQYDEEEYLKEIENISDVGLKYLLHAIIDESQGDINCIELYELASKNNCTVALYKLARLYDESKMFAIDVNKSTYYYYMYYNKINNLGTFCEMLNVMREPKLCRIFMDKYHAIKVENDELRKQCSLLTTSNKKLQERITELEYMPNGVGYNNCKKHFESLVKKNS